MSNPIITKTVLTTATFGDDSGFPDTAYGKEIPVEIVAHREDGDAQSITVKIGGNMFPLSELENLLVEVAAHKAAMAAGNNVRMGSFVGIRIAK